MNKNNNFVFDREQKDLELKLENDNLTLIEQIQKLQQTIKKMKSEVNEYSEDNNIVQNNNIQNLSKKANDKQKNLNNYSISDIPYKKTSPNKNMLLIQNNQDKNSKIKTISEEEIKQKVKINKISSILNKMLKKTMKSLLRKEKQKIYVMKKAMTLMEKFL